MMEDYDTPLQGDCTDCGAYYCGMGLKPPCDGCKYREDMQTTVPPGPGTGQQEASQPKEREP